ncbi:DUF1127 domain-containing protein [Bradyrhizobium manausense]|uniref:DUF1127 domain-containing protein n=1 Tax=Bradyrhizobium TaxID=374 RepID=UPI001BAE3B60|nr:MULTISPECIES: DUF1127 domain-containing protein [Bradyrhizobium]MBR0825209.1 DUF1127 domain-containing protein [Bradyrhizobium manausense]UVO28397.1 DUF1127 domain-containing protein [Bradyrhizobium arachidis]
MSTTHDATWLARTSITTRYLSNLIWRCWDALQEHLARQDLRATLSGLSDRELMDIGARRGEIDYLASHRATDPRDIRDRMMI